MTYNNMKSSVAANELNLNGLHPQFSDLVVEPDTSQNFIPGITNPSTCQPMPITLNTGGGTFTFPAGYNGLWVALEAARGNLESVNTAELAGVNYTKLGVTPQQGWLAAYQQYSIDYNHAQPIGNAMQAAANFFTIMNNDCDSHFGFVTFGNGAASAAAGSSSIGDNTFTGSVIWGSTTNPLPMSAGAAPPVGGAFNDPWIAISPTPGTSVASTQFSTVMAAVDAPGYGTTMPLLANGGTDIAGGLTQAYTWLTSAAATRANSHKAIVLFTDGLPNSGSDSWNGSSESDPASQAIATQCGTAGIPIYCVGLCMPTGTDPTMNLQSIQAGVLSANQGSTGLAAESYNGQFYQVTSPNPTALNIAFENVARSLVQLVATP
jgi:hypothetical protein